MTIKRKAVFFSIDALVALSIILIIVFISYPFIKETRQESDVQSDILQTFSKLKASETNDSYLQSLITQKVISNANKTLLEAIGEVYITNATKAQLLVASLFTDLASQENIGIWYGTTLLAATNKTPYENATDVEVSRQIISGLKEGASVTGFSARASLSTKRQTKYTYFGGYVGEGNISLSIPLNGTVLEASVEFVTATNVSIVINGNVSGTYAKSPIDTQPVNYTLPTSSFLNGTNAIEFRAVNGSIAGGFVKLVYTSSVQYDLPKRIYLPGVQGLINVYDGLSVPGTLNNISLHLHYQSPYQTFVTIGNITIFNESNGSETTRDISNAQLAPLLNYNKLSNTTTPLRVGLENISLTGSGIAHIDVVLITDVSGSMDWRLDSDSTGVERTNCSDPLMNSPSTKRISLARCLDKQFVQTILNSSSDSRVALISFSNDGDSYVSLTRNQATLNQSIDAYTANGATCIACALNRAHTILQTQSNATRSKYIVMMTDGVANRRSTATCTNLIGNAALNTTQPQAGGLNGVVIQKKADNSWVSLQTGVATQINDIDFYNTTRAFAVGASGTILQWNGTGWSLLGPLPVTLNGLDIFNATYALAVGNSGRVMRWNGASWSSLVTLVNSPTLNAIKIFNGTLAFMVGVRSNTGRIYKSTNGGSTWSEDHASGTNFRGITIINKTLAFAVGNSGRVMRWNGASWSQISSSTTEDLYSVDAFNGTTAFAVGGNNGKSISIRWNGASWSSVLDTVGDSLRDVQVLNNISYAHGEGAMIFERSATQWNQKFNFPLAYQGNLTAGISCTADDDSCTEAESYPYLNANYSACRARAEVNSTIYTIGFGPIESCGFANITLQAIAQCGNGSFYSSSNASILQQFYATIAQDIIHLSFSEQTAQGGGNISTRLYPDSYLEIGYTKTATPYGLMIAYEKKFTNDTTGIFTLPLNSTVLEARVASYSGPRWTTVVTLNGNVTYNLTQYGSQYTKLGDPYYIGLPLNALQTSNIIDVQTGLSPQNMSTASAYDKILYTVIKNASGYSPIVSTFEGCIWSIDFDTGKNISLAIPSNYTGTNTCTYQTLGTSYNNNDAAQEAVFRLLQSLDLDRNNRADVEFTAQDVDVTLSTVTGIPFTWSTEVQVRTWR